MWNIEQNKPKTQTLYDFSEGGRFVKLFKLAWLALATCPVEDAMEEMLLLGRVDYIRLQDLTQLLIQSLHLKTKLANDKLSSNSVCDNCSISG